jgi:TIR domain
MHSLFSREVTITMSYAYDIFISYKKTDIGKYWVSKYFAPCLRHELGEILGRKAEIFFDEDDIRTGERWPDKLKRALASSKVLVPIFSGTYFCSEWCTREFVIIHHRQSKTPELAETGAIIVPVLVRDGDHLPKLAKELQYKQFHDYYTSCESFRAAPDFRKFEKAVEELAHDLHRAIQRAPKYDPAWGGADWLEISLDQCLRSEEVTIETNPVLK